MAEADMQVVHLMDLDVMSKLSSSSMVPCDDYADFPPTSTSPEARNCDSAPTTSSESSVYTCAGCGFDIRDRFVLKVMDETWHEHCLRCCTCQMPLSTSGTCFEKDGRIYCREDHAHIFGRKCGRCGIVLQPSDVVFRCIHTTYHQACFSCIGCGVNFKKGDEYHIINDEALCRADYQLLCAQQQALHMPSIYDFELSESNRKTPKRPRTILNAQQRRQFKSAFEKSAKPCRKVREQLAKETGLSVRVVQVWFQNQRAKMKKQQRKEATGSSSGSSNGQEVKSEEKSDSEEEIDSDDDLENSNSKTDKMMSSSPVDFKDHHLHGGPMADDNSHLSSNGQSMDNYGLPPSALMVPSTPIDKLYNMQHTYFSFA